MGTRSPSAVGVADLLDILRAIEIAYDIRVLPVCCSIELDLGESISWTRANPMQGEPRESNSDTLAIDQLTIAVEMSYGPLHSTPTDGIPDCIIRPAFLPVPLAVSPKAAGKMSPSVPDQDYQKGSQIQAALRLFLRHLYRKREFREGQGEALLNVLKRIDTIVLLPTGGGKSIIYQLAGLLMPGVTLVVDPLIALMEDQVEGLETYGIDRAVAIFRADRATQERKINLMELGQFHFVFLSPERLQSPRFREALHGLASRYPINLAVIDEAHCVSEWGHDFRPAYLSLANSLRTLSSSSDTIPPTLLAMTGTASRAVLRDMINDLEIDRNNSDALIRPDSFDRKEIKFRIIRTRPAYAAAKLRAELRRLPSDWGMPSAEYYKPRGRKTNSGIVFVPTVQGKTGIDEISEEVNRAMPAATAVTVYSGKPPRSVEGSDWDRIKRQNARRFKRDEAPVLVSTKAYGMGIDKPNIRYTIHFGVPSSLEQYYQEAGRAGRDRKSAYSTLILGETSEARSDRLLDPDLGIEELRRLCDETGNGPGARDDITRSLFFHLRGFLGTEIEIQGVRDLIVEIIDKPAEVPISLPFGDKAKREKSIYRLYKLGFVSDYTVDFGRRVFEIITVEFDFHRFRNRFLDYVRNVAPGKLRSIRRSIDRIEPDDKTQALVGLATSFINFTYDEIERARRRAIQEAILLARQSKSDAEVRKRLLDYLQEGVGYEKIDELLQREQVDLHEWIALADKVGNPIEAGELRGLCIRALESSPDHPGLLLIRGVIETITSDYYWNVASTSIARAILVGMEKYDITAEHIESTVRTLFEIASATQYGEPSKESKSIQLEPALVMALLDVAKEPQCRFAAMMAMHWGARSTCEETLAALAWFRSDELVNQLQIVTDSMAQESRGAVTYLVGRNV